MKDNILLIGCGRWGKNWYKTILNSENCDLVAVVDPKINKNDFTVSVYDKIEDVKEEFSHIIISTPAKTHLNIYRQLKNLGIEDNKILIEKPAGMNFDEAFEMRNCFHNFIWLHDEGYQIIKERKNSIGIPLRCDMLRASMGPTTRTDISILEDYAIHDLYLYLDMFEIKNSNDVLIENVYTNHFFKYPIKPSVIDIQLSNYTYPADVHIFSSWWYPKKERKMILIGTMGSLIWENNSIFINRSRYEETPGQIDGFGNEGYKLITAPEIEIQQDIKDNKSNLEKQLDYFINNNKSNTTDLLINTWSLIKKIKEKNR